MVMGNMPAPASLQATLHRRHLQSICANLDGSVQAPLIFIPLYGCGPSIEMVVFDAIAKL
jgi:hypothetical protein